MVLLSRAELEKWGSFSTVVSFHSNLSIR